MQAYWIKTKDDQSIVELRDTPKPVPKANQVLVRVRASGLNRGEFIRNNGLHGQSGAAKAVGNEAAGEVVELGADVRGLKLGDRVMGRSPGAFAEYALMDAREAIPVPPKLSWEQAAAIPLVFMVVYDMLVAQGHVAADEWLLVTGISSGVGVGALQMAKALSVKVIGTSGSADKLKRLEAHGLDVGVCTRRADFFDAVMRATDGKGVNLVVNAVGGSMFAECIRSMAYEGRFATVGYVDGILKSEIDIAALHTKRLTLFGVSNKLRTAEQRIALVAGFVADILPMFADGRIKPLIDKVYPFSQLEAAKDYMEANLHLGKIVVSIPD